MADKRGQRLNKTIKQPPGRALDLGREPHDRRQHFQDLFGSWSKEEFKDFIRLREGFSRIDSADWELGAFSRT